MTRRELALVIKTVAWTLFFLWLGWFLWSCFDMAAHQLDGGTQNPLNLIRLLMRT